MTTLKVQDVEALARGLAFLGSGGGGDVTYAGLLVQGELERYGPLELVSLAQVPPDALVLPLAFMGAPSVGSEKLEGIDSLLACVARARADAGGRTVFLSVAEIGGANGMAPLMVAGRLGLQVVDADMVGRAFPELQMASTTLLGPRQARSLFAAETGDALSLDTADASQLERVGRALTLCYGGSLAVVPRVLSGQQAKDELLAGGLARALAIGRAKGLQALALASEGMCLLRARVSWVERNVAGGFVRGTVHLVRPEGPAEIVVQNEFLALRCGGELQIASPDLLTLVDVDSGCVLTSDEVVTGSEVDVWTAPAPPLWYTPEGLRLVDAQAMGLGDDLRPVGRAATIEEKTR